jgi:hypothetical protein
VYLRKHWLRGFFVKLRRTRPEKNMNMLQLVASRLMVQCSHCHERAKPGIAEIDMIRWDFNE